MKIKVIFVLLVVLLYLSSVQAVSAQTKEAWDVDYEAMKAYMAEAYANLEWAREGKKIDLAGLDKETKGKLRKASSNAEYREIFDEFLESFQDGHLRLSTPEARSIGTNKRPTAFSPGTPPETVCKELGYKFKFHRFSLPFNDAPNFKLISTPTDYFPAGVFSLENGERFGVLDISLFSADGFLGNCIAGWKEFSGNLKGSCDESCVDRFNSATEDRLTGKLSEQLRVLQSQKLDYLIVDIGGNGGGSNWVEPVARIISPKPLRGVEFGFIRHPHWVAILEERLKIVVADLAGKDLNTKQNEYLKTAKKRLEQHLKEAKSSCDRSYVWMPEAPKQKECSLLSSTPGFTSGVFERLPADEISNLKSKTILFQPTGYRYEESVFNGKLIVLVDKNTASAAENFASYMQASKSGIVVGEKTFGAGCGYVDGGTKYVLPNSRLQLHMPDCVRYRADGVNEVEGIEPDISLWTTSDSKSEKLSKLLKYLAKMQKE